MNPHAYLHYSQMAAEAEAIVYYGENVREWAEKAARQFTPADYALDGLEQTEFVSRLIGLANEYLPGVKP